MLNSQPLGFYSPAQLVQDARDHAVVVAPTDINLSFWIALWNQLFLVTPRVRLCQQPTRYREVPITDPSVRMTNMPSTLSSPVGMRMESGLQQAIADKIIG